MNLIGCGLNDIYDYESDRRSRRRRTVWGAVVDDAERPLVWCAALAMVPLVLLSGTATGNQYNVAAVTCLVLVAWLYSVPPVRFKERPPLDSLANGLGYFLLPLVMGYSLGGDPCDAAAILLARSACVVFMRWRRRPTMRPTRRPATARWRCALAAVPRLRALSPHLWYLAGRRFPQHGRSGVCRGVYDGSDGCDAIPSRKSNLAGLRGDFCRVPNCRSLPCLWLVNIRPRHNGSLWERAGVRAIRRQCTITSSPKRRLRK